MRRLAPFALVGLALLLAAGCAKVRGVVAPNRPPETTLWVTGNVDTVSHTQRVFWDGQDPDGSVSYFEFRWVYAPGAAPAGYDSSLWVATTDRDSLFTVYSPNGVDFPTLVLRAIDDQGTPDPTPARQTFVFSNAVPTVHFSSTPPDTTLPVVTFTWSGSDPDGDIARATYRVWLDGAEDRATTTTGTSLTLTPIHFENALGTVEERVRKAYVVAIDDGGRVSLPDSFSWYVRLPVGTTLLVDDMPNTVPGFSTADPFYRGELNTRLGAGNYTIIDLQARNPFRSQADVRETFRLFENVFWYSEQNPGLSAVLLMADQPIRTYLDGGGNLFLTSSRFVGTGGALDDAFAHDVLGVADFRINQKNQTTNFELSSPQFAIGVAPFDSLMAIGIYSGIESFVLASAGEASYVAPEGTLDTLHVGDWPIGINRQYGAGQGRIVYLPFPLRGMNAAFSGHSGRAAAELQKVFTLFGM
jgi:hypothetical protein